MNLKFSFIASALVLSACASSGIVPMDKGTYLLTRRSGQVGTGDPVGTKAKVYAEASQFCLRQGLSVETVNLLMSPTRVARPGSVELQFRCVPK
jgi:hypothetical protein